MSLTSAANSSGNQSLDVELEELQSAVATARQNSWYGGDVVDPEFTRTLATLTQSTLHGPAADGNERPRRNLWREVEPRHK